MNIAVYISGHGFGHLAQMAPVLNRIHQIRPECRFLIRCALSEGELRARLDFDFELDAESVDIGVIQKSAIEEDRDGSIALMRQWTATMADRIEREIDVLNRFKPSLVFSNISPLAFPAARALGIPSVGLATLDWFTIYSHWLETDDPVITTLKEAYEMCDLLLTPPMAMDMDQFPRRQSIPLIAAHPSVDTSPFERTRKHVALVIFGGSNQPAFDIKALAAMDAWQFLIPSALHEAPENVTSITFGPGCMAVDLMPFVDVVVCKPGYGILAESWRTGTPMAWVERPDFPEYPMLKAWLEDVFPSHGMNRTDFGKGRWLSALSGALASTRQFPDLHEDDGAIVAANAVLSRFKG